MVKPKLPHRTSFLFLYIISCSGFKRFQPIPTKTPKDILAATVRRTGECLTVGCMRRRNAFEP